MVNNIVGVSTSNRIRENYYGKFKILKIRTFYFVGEGKEASNC